MSEPHRKAPAPPPAQRRLRVVRVVSGGQSGADRAGLDVAIELGIEYGGWCPQGGWAEDYAEPPGLLRDYPMLREAPSPDPGVRTRLNVRDSDATLIVRAAGVDSPGTDLTRATAADLSRPCLVTGTDSEGEVAAVAAWLSSLPSAGSGLTLNVAGPRETHQPGVYQLTRSLLRAVLGDLS